MDIVGRMLAIVQQVVNGKNINATVSCGWWDSFKKTNPDVVLRCPEPLSKIRLNSTSNEVLSRYCDILQCTLSEYKLHNMPTQIYNLDESGMPLDPKSPHVVAMYGQKHPAAVVTGDRKQVTVLACCSTSGHCIPPLVVFKRKSLT